MNGTQEFKGKAELDRFLEHLIGEKKSRATQEGYIRAVRQMLMRADKEPQELTQEDLDRYKVELAKKYNNNTMIAHIAAINNFCQNVLKKELKLKPPSRVIKNVLPLTPSEVEKMFEASENNSMDNALIKLLYYSQLRKTEVISLNIDDIDFEQGKLRVNSGKGRDYSIINLHPIALESLQNYIMNHRFEPKDGTNALFVSREYRRISKNIPYQRVKEYAAKAGITKRVYPHLFRHSAITHMAENGATLPQIQQQSRHKDIKTLMRYVHLSESHAKEVYLKTMPVLGNATRQNQVKIEKRIEQIATENLHVQPAIYVNTVEDRELKLLDLLVEGKISEETYNLAVAKLEKLREKHEKFVKAEVIP